MTIFQPHGNYQVYWQGKALFVCPSGSFNEQGALKFNRLIAEAAETGTVRDWCRIEWFGCKNTMGTPEAEQHLLSSFIHSKKHGCKRVITIGANICAKQKLRQVCQTAGLVIAHVDDIAQGQAQAHLDSAIEQQNCK